MKKRISLLLALAMVLSVCAAPTLAAPKVPDATPQEGAREAVILEKNPFHCNTFGGNGRAYAELFEEKLATDKALKKAGIGGVMEELVYLSDNAWLLANTEDYVCSVCGRTKWVSFSNKSGVPNGKNMQFTHAAPVNYTEIIKIWTDGEGVPTDEIPDDVEAIFDIYLLAYDENDLPVRGEIVISGAVAGVQYTIEPGTYVVAERPKEGYLVQPDQIITVTYDESGVVTFINTPEVIASSGIALMKTVDGVPIIGWEVTIGGTIYGMADVAKDIKFRAYKVDKDGAAYTDDDYVSTGMLDDMGIVAFGELDLDCWYAIEESFEADSLAADIFHAPKVQYFYVIDEDTVIAGAFNYEGGWVDPEKTFHKVNAVAVDDYVMDKALVDAAVAAPGNSHVGARANVANAFGSADALQNAGNNLFTGLAFFPEGVTYYFGDNNNGTQEIYNNPDKTLPDLSFIEVTWSNNWHTEAVDVYLVNALMADGTVKDSLPIGRVYNRKDLANREVDGFGFEIELKGNFTYTNVFFPDNVIKASAVRLVDATTKINTPTPTYNTWKFYDDGYDLDAMVAYYALPTSFENKFDYQPQV